MAPDSSQVRFQVLGNNGEPIENAFIQNWIFSLSTDENGFTDWISMLPILNDKEPYAAKATLPNGQIIWSEPFFVNYGEKKVISMEVKP